MKSVFFSVGAVFLVLLGILGSARGAETLAERWRVQTSEDGGALQDLTQGNTERGLAVNPTNERVLVVSRASGSPAVLVVDGADADLSHSLDVTGIGGGIFPLNVIGVADDGAVYACNLVLPTSSGQFKIYKWEDDASSTPPQISFEGDPAGVDEFDISLDAQRWGDSIDVRGSGLETQILIGARASGKVAVLTTQDGDNFEAVALANAGNAQGNLGVAFGAGDTAYAKDSNQPLRHFSFDLGTGTAALLSSFNSLPNAGRPIGVDVANNRLAMLVTNVSPPLVQLYDISSPDLDPVLSDEVSLDTSNPNSNATGGADFGTDALFVLQTNNGIAGYDIEDDNLTTPPVIETQPISRTVIAGGGVSFSVVVSGTPPFDFKWRKDAVDIDGATSSSLVLPAVVAGDAGAYTLVVSNSAGSVTSDGAVLTVVDRVDGDIAAVKWEVSVDDRPYLATDNAQRGLGVNPVNGNVLVVSRTGGEQVRVLNGSDGTDLRSLDVSAVGGVSGATFQLSMIGVGDDGAVYASNLSLDGDKYRIYRWADDGENTVAAIAFDAEASGNPIAGQRFGDTLAVRGSGADTQILIATRSTAEVVLFTTSDGESFDATPMTVTGATGNFGLGLAFGAGNTFWGNAQGRSLFHCAFDPGAGTANVVTEFTTADFPASNGPISVAPQYGLLAAISNENPDNIQVFDISNPSAPPVLLDQEFLSSDNANQNGTGALAFGDAGLVGLGTNNGVSCLSLDVSDRALPSVFLSDVRVISGDRMQFTLTGEVGKTYLVEESEDMSPGSWDEFQDVFLMDSPTQEFTVSTLGGRLFFRAVLADE